MDNDEKEKVDVTVEVYKGAMPENILSTANIDEFVIGQEEDTPILDLSCRASAKVKVLKTNEKGEPILSIESLSIHSFQLTDMEALTTLKSSLESEEWKYDS